MEIDMTGVEMDVIAMQREVGVRDRARLVGVLVGMRVRMCAAVAMRVSVHGVGVVVVSAPIRVGNIRVILIPRIRVIAMAVVQMIRVGHIPMVLVRRGFVLVLVISMLHIPEVLVRRVLRRAVQMARPGGVGMILVGGCVGVIRMEHVIEVIRVPAVRVIVEREIAMRVAVIAMVAVRVPVSVLMRRRI